VKNLCVRWKEGNIIDHRRRLRSIKTTPKTPKDITRLILLRGVSYPKRGKSVFVSSPQTMITKILAATEKRKVLTNPQLSILKSRSTKYPGNIRSKINRI